jgi:hypothetical protein
MGVWGQRPQQAEACAGGKGSEHASNPCRRHGQKLVYHSAIATFFAPSDLSGVSGMRNERIRALPSWRNGPSRYDMVLVSTNSQLDGMLGLDVGRVHLFFSFTHEYIKYPCALISWYDLVSDSPDEDTGMWIVRPVPGSFAVIHVDTIL